ncbi:MAG: glycosyltransferase family 2 protein [Eubacteriales bacterium]|nr:glycosyltransferase family 2 protein [Eubacteriales bacterium]
MEPIISIVIPVYNGEKTIYGLCQEIISFCQSYQWDFEIILVDDGSSDQSKIIMTTLSLKNPTIKSVFLTKNHGQQNAIFCGLSFAAGQYILTMDDDGQHPVSVMAKLMERIETGYDIVYAVTDVNYDQLYRNLGSNMTDKLFTYLLKKPSDKRISSFRIMRASLVKKILNHPYIFVYISASVVKHTHHIENIYYEKLQRRLGQSNYTFSKQLLLFLSIILYYAPWFFLKPFRQKGTPYHIERKINL